MEPTIYKPSIYKGAGIYNNGAGGGGGGDNAYFKKGTWDFVRNTCIDVDNKKIKYGVLGNAGLGGITSNNSIDLTNIKNVEFQVKYFAKSNETSPSAEVPIINAGYYGSGNSGYRLMFATLNKSSSKIVFKKSHANGYMNVTSFEVPIDQTLEHEIKIIASLEERKLYFYLDGSLVGSSSIDYLDYKFWPSMFYANAVDTYESFTYIHNGEYIDMNNTYLKFDDELIFGY